MIVRAQFEPTQKAAAVPTSTADAFHCIIIPSDHEEDLIGALKWLLDISRSREREVAV
jgi:hypothetical protein